MTASDGFQNFALISALLGVVGCVIVFALSNPVYIFIIAYLTSFAFAGSNFFVMSKINVPGNTRFLGWFAASFAVRFIGAIIAVIIGLKILNSNQILFTVSFLFSYLCHSIIEIIYLNKTLKNNPDL